MLPKLEAKGIKAYLVTIGTAERGLEFAGLTSFPATNLLADPNSVTYAALGLRKGIVDMFFNLQVCFCECYCLRPWWALVRGLLSLNQFCTACCLVQTPLSIGARIAKDGAAGLREAISSWKPWIPPNQGQSRQQGGTYIFKGRECMYEHKDVATGAHANLDEVVRRALSQL